jgi:hypothetical protein
MDETEEVARWALAESNKLQANHRMGSPLEHRVIESWTANRPKMVARLTKYGAVNALAHVLVDRMLNRRRKTGPPSSPASQTESGRRWSRSLRASGLMRAMSARVKVLTISQEKS